MQDPYVIKTNRIRANHFRVKVCQVCALLVLSALLLICSASGFAAEEPGLDAGYIRIYLEEGRDRISDWQVRMQESDSAEAWHSLVTRNENTGVISHHLQLTGSVGEPQVWTVENSSCVSTQDLYMDGRLQMKMRLCDADTPYGLRLYIVLKNVSDQKLPESDIALALGPGLGEYPIEGLGIAESLYSYVQPEYSIDGEIKSEGMERGDDPVRINLDNKNFQWAGLESRYFALLLAPAEANAIRTIECRVGKSPGDHLPPRYLPEIKLYLDTSELQAGEVRKSGFDVFSGPKSTAALNAGTHDYQTLLFSGQWQWMRALCFGLLYVLSAIHAVIPNWGLSILILAVLVRGALYPLARKMMADQQKFALVQEMIGPEIKQIKGQYKGEEQSEAILSLYKKHGVSPFTGMKPLVIVLIQLPVFIALFHVLGQAVELQGASFLWIDSLGLPDRLFSFGRDLPFLGAYFNMLPFLMALSTLLTIMLSPSAGQNSIFLVIMAVGFLLLFYPFPSGMVLYWTTANFLQIFQQMLVKRKNVA